MMAGNVIYLENYVESTASLPSELTRALATIKELDIRSSELRPKVKAMVDACVAMPPHYSLKPNSEEAKKIVEMRKEIDAKIHLLLQWSDEKQSLAAIAENMLEEHIQRLEQDKAALEQELELEPLDMEDDFLADVPGVALSDEKIGVHPLRRESALDREMKAFAADASVKRERRDAQSIGAQISAAPSWDQGARGRTPAAPGGGASGAAAAPIQDAEWKRQQQLASLNVAQHVTPHGIGKGESRVVERKPSHSGGSLGKRQSSGIPDIKIVSRAPSSDMGLASALGFAMAPADVPMPYIPKIPTGLAHSGPAPQAPGRLLTHDDIRQDLERRMAELFWPDDNLWYLIEIMGVDLQTHKAQIMYVTGETEELDLNDIVREGHMSLMETRRNNSII